MVCYPASSNQKMCGLQQYTGVETMLNWYQGPKVCQEISLTHYTSTSMKKAGWIHAVMLFMPKSDTTI